MNVTEKRTITYRPVWLIIVVICVIFVSSGLLQRDYYKDAMDNIKENLNADINALNSKIKVDSILLIEIEERIKNRDEVIDSLIKEKDYFKNKAYANYKKYVNEASANYDSGTDDDKNNTFTDLINEQ